MAGSAAAELAVADGPGFGVRLYVGGPLAAVPPSALHPSLPVERFAFELSAPLTSSFPSQPVLNLPQGSAVTLSVGGVGAFEGTRDAEQVSRVLALGDINGRHQLKHMANGEAKVVRHNLSHPNDLREFDGYRDLPAGKTVLDGEAVLMVPGKK